MAEKLDAVKSDGWMLKDSKKSIQKVFSLLFLLFKERVKYTIDTNVQTYL